MTLFHDSSNIYIFLRGFYHFLFYVVKKHLFIVPCSMWYVAFIIIKKVCGTHQKYRIKSHDDPACPLVTTRVHFRNTSRTCCLPNRSNHVNCLIFLMFAKIYSYIIRVIQYDYFSTTCQSLLYLINKINPYFRMDCGSK